MRFEFEITHFPHSLLTSTNDVSDDGMMVMMVRRSIISNPPFFTMTSGAPPDTTTNAPLKHCAVDLSCAFALAFFVVIMTT